MGIRKQTLVFTDLAARALGGYPGLRMCEFGGQNMRDFKDYRSAKHYFGDKGVHHVSLDITGKEGSKIVDLSKPVPSRLGVFDIVTNYGTSEHIQDQYQVFKNAHDLSRIGGFIVHCLPLFGYWDYHGWVGYDGHFLEALGRANEYVVLANTITIRPEDQLRRLTCAVFKRTTSDFVSEEIFAGLGGIHPYDFSERTPPRPHNVR